MASLYMLEAANIFAGTSNPSASNHLALAGLKLPGMEEAYTDHMAGGAPVGIEINTHITRPECTFNLLGVTAGVQSLFGSWAAADQKFTAYGGIRDRSTGRLFKATAIMWGRLGKATPSEFNRGQNFQHEYAIRGITHYELIYAGQQMWYWDFFTNDLVIGGVDINGEMNSILSITGASGASGGIQTGGDGGVQQSANQNRFFSDTVAA